MTKYYMFSVVGSINDALEELKNRGLKVVESLPGRGNRDCFYIMQNEQCKWFLISFMHGVNLDDEETTIVTVEKQIMNQGVLF